MSRPTSGCGCLCRQLLRWGGGVKLPSWGPGPTSTWSALLCALAARSATPLTQYSALKKFGDGQPALPCLVALCPNIPDYKKILVMGNLHCLALSHHDSQA